MVFALFTDRLIYPSLLFLAHQCSHPSMMPLSLSLCLLYSFNVVEMWILPFHFMELPKVRPWFPFSNTMYRSFRSWGTLRRNENFKPKEALDSVRSCVCPWDALRRPRVQPFQHFYFQTLVTILATGSWGERCHSHARAMTKHDIQTDLQINKHDLQVDGFVNRIISFSLCFYSSDFFSYRSIM